MADQLLDAEDEVDEEFDNWCSVINDTKFEVLKFSRRLKTKQPRILKMYVPADEGYFDPRDARIVVSHIDHHRQEIIFLRDLKAIRLSANEDRLVAVDYTDSTSDKGGQSLLFSNFAERQMFAHFVRLLSGEVQVLADSEWVESPSPDTPMQEGDEVSRVVHRCETVNSLGLRTDVSIVLDYALRSMSIAIGSSEAIDCPLDLANITLPTNSSTKLEIIYRLASGADMMASGGGSTGIHVLQKALDEKKVESATRKKRTMLLFPSPYMRERFASRFRAIKVGGADSTGELPSDTTSATSVAFNGEMLRIFCGTFNVGDKKPPVEKELDTWLKSGEFDIYAIGLQECSNQKHWVKAVTALICGDEATTKATRRLAQTNSLKKQTSSNYVMCGKEHLWDIHIMLLARTDVASKMTGFVTATEATGFAHILGNKGAAALAFVLDGTTRICFVSAHLAARAERCRKREENYQEICAGMRKLRLMGVEWNHSCNHVFFLGDLNFRIDMGSHGTPEEFDRVLSLTRSKDLARMQAADTLILQMQQRSCFVGFTEGAMNFLPTYRMIKGAPGYNNKNNQNPSYCDRVLYMSDEGAASENLSLLWYEALPNLMISDHRPVCAGFEFFPKAPYMLAKGLNRAGAMDECVVLLQGLSFIRAPEPSHAKLTSWQQSFAYDGNTNNLSFEVRADGQMLIHGTFSQQPVTCANPEACANHAAYCGCSAEDVEKAIWGGGLPCWTSEDSLVLRPTIADADWLRLQTITVVVGNCGKGTDGIISEGDMLAQAKIPLLDAFSASVVTQRDLRESRASRVSRSSQGNRMSSSGLGGGDSDPFGDVTDFGGSGGGSFASSGLSMNKSSSGVSDFSRMDSGNSTSGPSNNEAAKQRKAWDRSIIEDGHVTLSPHLQRIYAPLDDDYEDDEAEDGFGGGLGGGTSNGSFFSVPALLHGKWVGVLCGRAEMVPLGGVTDTEELDVTKDQLLLWHDLTMRMRREAMKQKCKVGSHGSDAASTVQQQTAQSVKLSRRSALPDYLNSSSTDANNVRFEGHTETQEHVSIRVTETLQLGRSVETEIRVTEDHFGQNQSDDPCPPALSEEEASQAETAKKLAMASAPLHVELQSETMILNFNLKRQRVLDKERRCLILQFQGGEGSDDEDEDALPASAVRFADSSNDDLKQRKDSSLVWMEGSKVITLDGRQLELAFELGGPEFTDSERFVCSVTGEGLGGEHDFIVKRRRSLGQQGQLLDFYSRTGFLRLHADAVDAATLQPLKEHDHFVTALGGYKFKTENFRCAHSGVELFGVPFFESGGRAYSEAAYLELFHSCPGCLEPVALDAVDKVVALGCVWHKAHLKCVSCEEEGKSQATVLSDGDDVTAKCFAHDAGDGKGFQPFCESCYKFKFCPTCEGCGDAINPQTEDLLEAAGACWHTDHFRCVDSGEVLNGEFFTVQGLPYSRDSFFKLFGKQCMVCQEVILGDTRVEALDHHWHEECFICSATGLPLSPSSPHDEVEFWSHLGKPYSKEAYFNLFAERCFFCKEPAVLDLRVTSAQLSRGDMEEDEVLGLFGPDEQQKGDEGENGGVGKDVGGKEFDEKTEDEVAEVRRVYHPECLHCVASGKPLDGDEVFLGDDDGLPYSEEAYLSKFRSTSSLTGAPFGEGEEIFFMQGLTLSKIDIAQVFHEHWCAGCAGAITGKLQVTPTVGGFKWHPHCLEAFRTGGEAQPVNPFEVDKKRVEDNEAAKALFAEKAAIRKAEKVQVLLKARSRCVEMREAVKEQVEVLEEVEEEGLTEHVERQTPPEPMAEKEAKEKEENEEVKENEVIEMPPGTQQLASVAEQASEPSEAAEEQLPSPKHLSLPALPAFDDNSLSPPRYSSSSETTAPKPSRRATISNECRGLLWKQGGGSSLFGSKNWKQRWFVLLPGGTLTYYKDETDWASGRQPLKDAFYKIKSCSVAEDSNKTPAPVGNFGFIIQPRNAQGGPRRMVIRVDEEGERDKWAVAFAAYAKKT